MLPAIGREFGPLQSLSEWKRKRRSVLRAPFRSRVFELLVLDRQELDVERELTKGCAGAHWIRLVAVGE